jgi:hypothetical protein
MASLNAGDWEDHTETEMVQRMSPVMLSTMIGHRRRPGGDRAAAATQAGGSCRCRRYGRRWTETSERKLTGA